MTAPNCLSSTAVKPSSVKPSSVNDQHAVAAISNLPLPSFEKYVLLGYWAGLLMKYDINKGNTNANSPEFNKLDLYLSTKYWLLQYKLTYHQ